MEKLIKLLLCASAIINLSFAAHGPVYYAIADDDADETTTVRMPSYEISPELVRELRDFLGLIPDATIDAIVAKHYIIDSEFRRAITFLRSEQFTQLLVEAQQVPEVTRILDFLHLNRFLNGRQRPEPADLRPDEVAWAVGPEDQPFNAYAYIGSPVNNNINIEFLIIEAGTYARYRKLLEQKSRTFRSFVEELMEHLPRAAYTQMINEKCQRSVTFAQFYAALRSDQLRPLVLTALKSGHFSDIDRTLNSNAIYLESLVPIAFQVISWGPTPPPTPTPT